ncbi:MAG: DNA repair protein RecO [Candidatus Omnitrophica bacterium]|nr:DNA repair protein RecO [Candidatus Omnitrophota bacterium]
MAIITTEAILLRRREIRETSLLLTCLTRGYGKIVGLIKGVRNARGFVDGFLEPFTVQGVVFYERTRSDIDLITQCDLREPFLEIRRDFAKMSYAGYFMELMDHLVQLRDPHPEVYDMLTHALRALGEDSFPSQVARIFEARLLAGSGVMPNLESLGLSKGAAASLRQMVEADWTQWGRLRLSRPVEEELTPLFYRLLTQHLEVHLKSREFLDQAGVA